MEQKIDKIFTLFEDMKNQDLFNICVRQIIEVHQQNPGAIHQILQRTLNLVFSRVNDTILQLQHRQIAAAIIEKVYSTYVQNMNSFLKGSKSVTAHLFDLQTVSQGGNQQTENSEINSNFDEQDDEIIADLETARGKRIIFWKKVDFPSLFKAGEFLLAYERKDIKGASEKDSSMNQQHLFQKLGISSSFNESSLVSILEMLHTTENIEQNANFDQQSSQSNSDGETDDVSFIQKGKNRIIEQKRQSLKRKQGKDASDSEDQIKKTQQTSETQQYQSINKQCKTEQDNKKNKNNNEGNGGTLESLNPILIDIQQENQFMIINPFNFIFQKCIENLLHPLWQIRHSSALVIKGFLQSDMRFIGFQRVISKVELLKDLKELPLDSNNENVFEEGEKEFQILMNRLREEVSIYIGDSKKSESRIQNIISHSLILIALDRFADYLSDDTNIIVRETASQILTFIFQNCYNDSSKKYPEFALSTLHDEFQDWPIEIQKDEGQQNSKELLEILNLIVNDFITPDQEWEVLQSSLFLIRSIIDEISSNRESTHVLEEIFQKLEKLFLDLLDPTQIDDIIKIVCECILIFIGQKNQSWFFEKKINFILEVINRIWVVTNSFDDITKATQTCIQLLKMIYLHPVSQSRLLPSSFQIENCFKLFYNKIWQVRVEAYDFFIMLIENGFILPAQIISKKINVFDIDQFPQIKNFLILCLQACVIEEHSENLQKVIQTISFIMGKLQIDQKIQIIHYFIDVALNDRSTFELTREFKVLLTKQAVDLTCSIKFQNLLAVDTAPIEGTTGSAGVNYFAYSENFDNPLTLNDANQFRIFKISSVIGRIFANFNDKAEIVKLSEEVFNQTINVSHAQNLDKKFLILIIGVMELLEKVDQNSPNRPQWENCFSNDILERILMMDSFDSRLFELEVLDDKIIEYSNSIKRQINFLSENGQEIKKIKDLMALIPEKKDQKFCEKDSLISTARQNYLTVGQNLQKIYELIEHTKNIILNEIKCDINNINDAISNFKQFAEQFSQIFTAIADCYYLQQFEGQNSKPQKLNLVIKPLMKIISVDKFKIVNDFISKSFFTLFQLMKFQGVAANKLMENIIKKFNKKFQGKSKLLLFNDESHRYHTYSNQYEAINSFFDYVYDHLEAQTFEKLPFLVNIFFLDSMVSQMQAFQQNNVHLDVKSSVAICQKLYPILRLQYQFIYSILNYNINNRLETVIMSLIQLLRLVYFLQSHSHQNLAQEKIEQENERIVVQVERKAIKISQIFFLNLVKMENMKNLQQIIDSDRPALKLIPLRLRVSALYNLLELIKQGNLFSVQILDYLLTTERSMMTKFSSLFILRVIKTLNIDDPEMKGLAYKCLGNLITCIFLQKNINLQDLFRFQDESINSNYFVNSFKFKISDIIDEASSQSIINQMEKGVSFITDFKNPSNFTYELTHPPQVELRQYQLEGIQWMGFLVKYKLNGALCDDMGLGKTLQTIMVIQNELAKKIRKRETEMQEQQNQPSQKGDQQNQERDTSLLSFSLQSSQPQNHNELHPVLIVTPPTLNDHWDYEIRKFCDEKIMKPITLDHLQKDQFQSRSFKRDGKNVWIVSYGFLQRNLDSFVDETFSFLIVDEGHLIQNPKTKVAQAVRQINAQHKFLLSGTPIQNNLHELWSIFDFLMPSYLGSEDFFRQNFSKLFNTNILKFSDEELLFKPEQQRVLKDLHKKVMPFILRRTKSEVLTELPQKVLQDYTCTMTDLQRELYEELEKNQINVLEQEIEQTMDMDPTTLKSQNSNSSILQQDDVIEDQQENEQVLTTKSSQSNIGNRKSIQTNFEEDDEGNVVCQSVLSMLTSLRKLVNHPALIKIMGSDGKKKTEKTAIAKRISSIPQPELQKFENSGQFIALKQLLNDLGYQDQSVSSTQEGSLLQDTKPQVQQDTFGQKSAPPFQNQILIFSRFKETLLLIQQQLLQKEFPQIKFLHLSGDIHPQKRFPIVNKFNENSDFSILLLTTSVGGLGLNLNSANIVIMFDHDYNPMNDMQAIDRAHRIGQQNTVHVYRMIMKDTLEEQIMGIQRFQINIANSIINIDNASISNIKDSNIVSLFDSAVSIQNVDKKQDVGHSNMDEGEISSKQINQMQGYAKALNKLQQDNQFEVLNYNAEQY